MTQAEMPIFSKTFDLLTWLLPMTNHFPRAHRHTFTQRLLDAAFDLRERLEEANAVRGAARQAKLQEAGCGPGQTASLPAPGRALALAGSGGSTGTPPRWSPKWGRLLGGWQKAGNR